MKHMIAGFVLITLPAFAWAQSAVDEDIAVLIKKLGSTSAKVREAATLTLQERVDALPALRQALKSSDAEIARRAADILDYHDRRPVRELRSAVKEGRVAEFIQLLAGWPTGKYEAEAWDAVRDLTVTLTDLHHKKGGAKTKTLIDRWGDYRPAVLSDKRITHATKADLRKSYFLRGGEVDLTQRRKVGEANQNSFSEGSIIVAAGAVRMLTTEPHVIFAGGPVELKLGCNDCIIVSGGNVTLDGDFGNSLIIARGEIVSMGMLEANRLVCGKKLSRTSTRQNIISENDLNPLGFIRWTDLPKQKNEPKAK